MQGKTINGYTMQRLLGVGGMGEVWYAMDANGKPAAVKFLNEEYSKVAQTISRFKAEADVMLKLDHPNIRKAFSMGNFNGRPAIIMEYLEGSDLKEKMKNKQRFTDEELKKWWNQLTSALNYTHDKGIVHRDIKPGNIVIDQKGNVKLLDFGIAKIADATLGTQTGSTLGTKIYMSPEQVKDSKRVSPKSDEYSLAVSFVHLLTGKVPYDTNSSSDYDILNNILHKPLDLSGVPMEWRGFLAPYLEKDPAKRPALRPFSKAVPAMKGETTVVVNKTTPVAKGQETTVASPAPKTSLSKPVKPQASPTNQVRHKTSKETSKKPQGAFWKTIGNNLRQAKTRNKEDVKWLLSEDGYNYSVAFLVIAIALFLVSLVLIIIGWINGTGHAPVWTWLFWESLVLGIVYGIWNAKLV